MRPEDTKCPHADIRFCPLYVAAHGTSGLGCDDGELQEGSCAVARGLSYAETLARLRVVRPRMVARLEFSEWEEQAKAQRARNLRAAGIH